MYLYAHILTQKQYTIQKHRYTLRNGHKVHIIRRKSHNKSMDLVHIFKDPRVSIWIPSNVQDPYRYRLNSTYFHRSKRSAWITTLDSDLWESLLIPINLHGFIQVLRDTCTSPWIDHNKSTWGFIL